MAQPLVLVGSGGFGRETAELVRAINTHEPLWNLLGFVDDDAGLWGSEVSGTRVLGGLDTLASSPDASVVICTGHPGNFRSRKAIVERLGLDTSRYATLVHPSASIGSRCVVGPGSVLLAGVVATTDVAIGSHVAVMPQAVFTHDDRLDDYVTVGAGARVAGTVHVAEGAYLGSGCLIRENRTIGPWSLVGMGAVVTRDVPPGEVWAGNPARFLRNVDA